MTDLDPSSEATHLEPSVALPTAMVHPCRSCGACCASFRVSFYRGEAMDEPVAPGSLPDEPHVPSDLVEPVSAFFVAMRGTHTSPPRCVALLGDVGHETACAIHAVRSSTCRDFGAAWERGEASPACDRARLRHGLPPLTPADWR